MLAPVRASRRVVSRPVSGPRIVKMRLRASAKPSGVRKRPFSTRSFKRGSIVRVHVRCSPQGRRQDEIRKGSQGGAEIQEKTKPASLIYAENERSNPNRKSNATKRQRSHAIPESDVTRAPALASWPTLKAHHRLCQRHRERREPPGQNKCLVGTFGTVVDRRNDNDSLAAAALGPRRHAGAGHDVHAGLGVACGRAAHALLDLARHRQEGLLDVARVLGRGLEEGDAQAVGEFLASGLARLSLYRLGPKRR